MRALMGPLGSTMFSQAFRSLGLAFGVACLAASPLAHSQVRIHITTAPPSTSCIMTTDANGLSLIPGSTDLQATGVTFDPAGCGQGGVAPPSPDNFALAGIPATGTLPLTLTITWNVVNAATCVGSVTLNGSPTTLAGWTDTNTASPESRTVPISQAGTYVFSMTCSNAASPPASVTSLPATLVASGSGGGSCTGPAGLTRLTTSNIQYGVHTNEVRDGVDLTEWNNIWGHGTADPNEPTAPWPGVSGAGPVILSMHHTSFVSAHFNTGASAVGPSTLTDQSNIGGPDIDVVMSATCGDFSQNTTYPACSHYSMPSDGTTHFQYFSINANPGTQWCPLQLLTDYYINIKFHDPNSTVECPAGAAACPLYTINYWGAP